jgi:cytochrome c5
MKTKWILVVAILAMLALLVVACSSSSSTSSSSSSSTTPGALDGKALLQARCTSCHGLDQATSGHGDATQWKRQVDRMINRGAVLTADEEQAVVNYLAQTYP